MAVKKKTSVAKKKGKKRRDKTVSHWTTLPDLSIQGGEKTENYFTDEQVAELQKKFGFKPSFRLDLVLEDAAFHYDCDLVDRRTPKLSDQKCLIEALRDYSDGLYHILALLGSNERERLYRHMNPRLLSNGEKGIRPDLSVLHVAALCVRKELEGLAPKTRQRDSALRVLIAELRRIYLFGTPYRDKITYSDYTGEYGGNFFEFLTTILTLRSIPHKNKGLGKLVSQILSKEDPKKLSRGHVE